MSNASDRWSDLPFQVKAVVSSFLTPKDVCFLSIVNQKTHRELTSLDFDQIYWKFLTQKPTISFYSLLQRNEVFFYDEDDYHLYIRLSEVFFENEVSEHCCIVGCFWRTQYMTTIAAYHSLACAFSLLSHQLVQ